MPLPPPGCPSPGCRLPTDLAGPSLASDDVLAVTSGVVWFGSAVVVWVLAGVVTAVVLSRRGHDLRSVLGLAIVLGPLFVPLAREFVRNREPAARPIRLDPPPDGSGRHAIVAVLGAPESVVDALPVLEGFRPVSAVTLTTLIDYQTAERREEDAITRDAERRLTAAAAFVMDLRPARVLLPGTVDTALARFAGDDHHVIVLTGATEDVGAERLSDQVGIPVVVAPRTRRTR